MKAGLSHSKPQFKILNATDIYKINLYQHLNLMHRLRNSDLPPMFNDVVYKLEYKIFELKLHLKKVFFLPIVNIQFLSENQSCGTKSSIKMKKD